MEVAQAARQNKRIVRNEPTGGIDNAGANRAIGVTIVSNVAKIVGHCTMPAFSSVAVWIEVWGVKYDSVVYANA